MAEGDKEELSCEALGEKLTELKTKKENAPAVTFGSLMIELLTTGQIPSNLRIYRHAESAVGDLPTQIMNAQNHMKHKGCPEK